MAPQQCTPDVSPPYSHRPTIDERVLAIAPDFSLAVDAIQVVQESFPGTSAEDAWEFIQKLARLVREDVRNRQRNQSPSQEAGHGSAQGRTTESIPSSVVPEDSPMHNAA